MRARHALVGFAPRRRVQFAGERWRCNLPSIPYPTSLPISQANSLARDCFSDISRALQGHRRSMDATARAQGPHARGNRRHVRGGDAGMKRHRPMAPRTTVYLERCATGSLADLHLHLQLARCPWPLYMAIGEMRRQGGGPGGRPIERSNPSIIRKTCIVP